MNDIERLVRNSTTELGLTVVNRKFFQGYTAHWHEFYEMEYVVSGSGTHTINGESHTISPHTLYFLTPTDIHSITNPDRLHIINIGFTEDWIADELYTDLVGACMLRGFYERPALRMLKEYESTGEHKSLALRLQLNALLVTVGRNQPVQDNAAADHWPPQLRKALSIIQLHFREDLELSELAREAGFSAGYLSKVFHDAMGVTFKEYVNSLRLQYAAKLLRLTGLPVSEVCHTCGYNSMPNFLRAFKGKFAASPGQYRRKAVERQDK